MQPVETIRTQIIEVPVEVVVEKIVEKIVEVDVIRTEYV
jgi:hypothetical protein